MTASPTASTGSLRTGTQSTPMSIRLNSHAGSLNGLTYLAWFLVGVEANCRAGLGRGG